EKEDVGIACSKCLNFRSGRVINCGIICDDDNLKEGFKLSKKRVKKENSEILSGNGLLINKTVFNNIKGFSANNKDDEFEELCLKVKKINKKVIFNPNAVLYC
ncbi:hypothetical protein ACFL4O_02765, partial [bacterium]